MIRIICIFYMCLYLCTCVEKTQTVKMNTLAKEAQQLNARNRASRHGSASQEVEEPTISTEPEASACSCSKIYDPVCGTNGHSYYNMCQMECDVGAGTNVTVAHQGNCIPF